MTDGELAGRFALEGEDEPFRELVRRHGAMVLRVCRRVTCDPHDAEDTAQQVFAILCARAGELGRFRSLAGWLYNVAWHAGRRMQRGRETRRRYETRAVRDAEVQPDGSTPEDELRELYRAIEMLPREYCEAIVLHHLQGLTVQQVAELMACSEGTTAARLSRGRAMMRERLARRGFALSLAGLESLLVAEVLAETELHRPILAEPASPDVIAAVSNAEWAATQGAARSTVMATTLSLKDPALGAGLLFGARTWLAAACIAGAATGVAATSAAHRYSDSCAEPRRLLDQASAFMETGTAHAAMHQSPSTFGRPASVPEPAGLPIVAIAALALYRRRRPAQSD